jgi:hypothetical protein
MINNFENRMSLALEIFDTLTMEDLRDMYIHECNTKWIGNTDAFEEAAITMGRMIICESDGCDAEATHDLNYVQYPSVCEKHSDGGA